MLRLVASVAFFTVTGCGFPGIPTVVDKSDFEVFEYHREAALGFCADLNDVIAATIRRDPDGKNKVLLTIVTDLFIEGDPATGECSPGAVFSNPLERDCLGVLAFPERDLTAKESSRMKGLFDHVGLWVGSVIFGDPCDIERYRWDEFEVSGCFCESPHLSGTTHQKLTEFVQSLKRE